MTIKYLAGNRIQGTSEDPITFRDNFVSDKWSNGSAINVDTTTCKLDYDGSRAADDGADYDVGTANVSESAWTLRFCLSPTTLTWSSVAEPVFIVLSDSNKTVVGEDSQDSIGIVVKIDGSHQNGQIRTVWGNSQGIGSGGESDLVPDLINIKGAWYVDITRTSATTFTVSVYRNSDYTNLVATKDVTGVTATGLRYIKVCNYNDYGADSTVNQGTISNLVFSNGGHPPVQVPTGSVYEETDTHKSYILNTTTETYDHIGNTQNNWFDFIGSYDFGIIKLLSGSPAIGTSIKKVKISLSKTGSPPDEAYVRVWDNNNNVVASTTFIPNDLLTTSQATYEFILPRVVSLGLNYKVGIEYPTSASSNYMRQYMDTSSNVETGYNVGSTGLDQGITNRNLLMTFDSSPTNYGWTQIT